MVKQAIFIFCVFFHMCFLTSCREESVEPASTRISTGKRYPDEYWGCWVEATGKSGVYDISLSSRTNEPHNITIGVNCGVDTVASYDIGFFRNDTLILYNGHFEFWCFLDRDTLLYSAYSKTIEPTIERLIKI